MNENNAILDNKFAELTKKLLAIGGKRVAGQSDGEYLLDLVDEGKLIVLPVQHRRGERGLGHKNAAQIWAEDPEKFQIGTGFGLNAEGIWRSHSWVLDDKYLHETTASRARYYGITLRADAAAQFWFRHYLSHAYSRALPLLLPCWCKACVAVCFRRRKKSCEASVVHRRKRTPPPKA